jgi:LmbE family N-acetylglucosaminyl deacetylase
MENRWLLIWLLAPIFSPGAMAVEACSLRWYRLDADMQLMPTNQNESIANSAAVRLVPPGKPKEVASSSPLSSVFASRLSLGERAQIVVTAIAVMMLLAVCSVEGHDAPRTLVAVFAHPDDEGPAAPILARYAREGARVYLVIATDGAQGGVHTPIPRGPELARVRSDEARCAADALNIHPPILLGFPDAELGNYAEDPVRLFRLTQQLQQELERLRPDAVLTWGPDGATGHPDHRLVSTIVTQLAQAGAPGVPERLFYVSIPVEGMRLLNPARAEAAFLVPLAKYFTMRIAFTPADADAARLAMACHRTQFATDVVQRVFELQKQVWNGTISLVPFSPTRSWNRSVSAAMNLRKQRCVRGNEIRRASVCGAQIRSVSRRALVFVQKPAETVATVHDYWLRRSPALNRRATVRRREVQAAVRSMAVVMINEHRERVLEMPCVHDQ